MSKRTVVSLIGAIALMAMVAGCGDPGEPTSMTPPGMGGEGTGQAALSGEVLVFVPCGVAGPYGEIKDLFEQQNPGVTVTQEVANIDVQSNKIRDGRAAPDVWISLGDIEMARVQEADKVDGEPITYAYNSVAMVVAKGNPCNIEAVQDLTSVDVKTLALPSESNSSGHYMKQALVKAGVWEDIQDKLWVTDEPSQVKMQLSSGKADVGVVYYPCTRETRHVGGKPEQMKGKVQLLGKVPTDLSGQIPAQAAVIKGCKNPDAGRAFCQFMLQDEAQDIWEKWAFDRAKQPSTGERVNLHLYCGAGIRPFMDAAIEQFQQQHSDIRVVASYAGSGCLLSQLTFARRGDLYMPGEDFYLNQAKDRGFITSDKLVGYFEPVLIVQKGNPKGVKGINDLARPGLKVGVGEPEAAAVGRAAADILQKANLTEQVKPNIALTAGNVPELGNAVQLKSLDVAIVWNVTAAQVAEKCDRIDLPEELYEPSAIPMGVLKFSEHAAQALQFVEFCAGAEGQRLVTQTGMAPAGSGGVAG